MISLLHAILSACALAIALAFYRLYVSPLSHIPGPKLAALTLYYEFYYDVILGGQYTFKIIELHKQYGPVIRISPWEVHVSDPDFYHTLYASSASGQRRNKYKWFTDGFGVDLSTFSSNEHELHRIRRSALAGYFSQQSVRKLEGLIKERVQTLLHRLRAFRDTGEVVNMSHAYAALTNDIVMTYSFARCDNRLEADDFDPTYRAASHFGSTAQNYLKHAPWVNRVMQWLPDRVAERLHKATTEFVRQKRGTLAQISAIKTGTDEGHGNKHLMPHQTIFHSILDSKLPLEEKSAERLADDAQVLMMAGTLTTAWALEVITYWLIKLPDVAVALKTELRVHLTEPDADSSLTLLGKLPYLNAVVQEGLRLSYGVCCRLARIDPDNDMVFLDRSRGATHVIPRGTPVGMTSVQIHHDETIFPQSRRFWPERWLDPSAREKGLDRYMVAFTAGTRQCVGKELAYAELLLCLGMMWRKWGGAGSEGEGDEGVLELFETGIRDVEIEADHFLPFQQKGSKGIRIKVSRQH